MTTEHKPHSIQELLVIVADPETPEERHEAWVALEERIQGLEDQHEKDEARIEVEVELRKSAYARIADLEEQLRQVEAIAQHAVDQGFLHQDEWKKVLEALRG